VDLKTATVGLALVVISKTATVNRKKPPRLIFCVVVKAQMKNFNEHTHSHGIMFFSHNKRAPTG